MFSVGMVSGQQLERTDIAINYALPYALNYETMSTDGPYDYENNSYYLVHFSNESGLAGELVFDANTGEVVKNQNISEKVIFAFTTYEYVDQEGTEFNDFYFIASLEEYKELSSRGYEFYASLSGNEYMTSYDADNLKKGACIYMDLEQQYSKLLSANYEVMNVTSIFNGVDRCVEDAEVFTQKQEDYYKEEQVLNGLLSHANKEMPFIVKSLSNHYGSNYDFMVEDLSFYEDELDRSSETISNGNSSQTIIQKDIIHRTELMRSRLEVETQELNGIESGQNLMPGFSSIFTITNLLILSILLKRNT
ncbi:hypothetical protein [uncultured Methanolobus sp.]|uniref:hypothetical protein n=1 Tax=uncultured Methanolobus sp. TaxID=218300 RepID=UPI0029C8F5B1|nr:hypothetical protein [uncultured Methanolobus sp.]